ncbi:UNVERIFIED_CONTAM: hypothetical protein O8I53_09545 [Campylobacter lari]
MSPKAAQYLFLGIVTDSGRFQFSDVSARTHELVAFLYKNGLNAEKIFSGLNQTTIDDINLTKLLFNNLKLRDQVAYTTVTLEETKSLNKTPNEVVRVNTIGNLKGYPF